MSRETLVYRKEIELNGERYEILVYCCENGRYFARTSFNENDIIVHDGQSIEEALEKHEKVFSIAITCRDILKQVYV
jgi:hypothetical protein